VPFYGFCESLLDADIDSALDEIAKSVLESNFVAFTGNEAVARDVMMQQIDFAKVRDTLAREWLRIFNITLNDMFKASDFKAAERLRIDLTFDHLDSPKDYFQGNDRIMAKMPLRQVYQMFAVSVAQNHQAFRQVIAERHTSCSGFVSFYPNNLQEFMADRMESWDLNKIGTLMRSVIVAASDYPDLEKTFHAIDDEVREYMGSNGIIDNAIYGAVENATDFEAAIVKACSRRAYISQEL